MSSKVTLSTTILVAGRAFTADFTCLAPKAFLSGLLPRCKVRSDIQGTVGIRSHHCTVIATDIKHKVDQEVMEAGGPSTTGRSKRVTLCVEGNISAGKSTFLKWVSQGHPELADLLEVFTLTQQCCSICAGPAYYHCLLSGRPLCISSFVCCSLFVSDHTHAACAK